MEEDYLAGRPALAEGKRPIARLSNAHEAMLNWLIVNPEKSQRELADAFGMTQSWVSTVCNSDLFQSALKEKQLAVGALVAQSVPQKLRMLADVGLSKLGDAMERSEDPEFLLDATDKILHRMGYAPSSSRTPAGGLLNAQNQQNNFFISGTDLTAARELMQATAEAAVRDQAAIPGEAAPVESKEELLPPDPYR